MGGVLVLGAGQIGSSVARHLESLGEEVTLVDLFPDERLLAIDKHIPELTQIHRVNVNNGLQLASIIRRIRPTTLLFSAGNTTQVVNSNGPISTSRVARSEDDIIRIALDCGVDRLAAISSLAVYDVRSCKQEKLDESAPTLSSTPYASLHLARERRLASYQKNAAAFIFRLPGVYGTPRPGSGQAATMINSLILAALRSSGHLRIEGIPKQSEDIIHRDDVGAMVAFALKSGNRSGGVFNIGRGRLTTVESIASAIAQFKPKLHVEFIPGGVQPPPVNRPPLAVEKFEAIFGMSSTTSIVEGIRRTLHSMLVYNQKITH